MSACVVAVVVVVVDLELVMVVLQCYNTVVVMEWYSD